MKTGSMFGCLPPHLFTTSHLTHSAITDLLEREARYGFPGELLLSPGRSIGLRFIPTVVDLQFAWEQLKQQQLEPRKQKVRDSARKRCWTGRPARVSQATIAEICRHNAFIRSDTGMRFPTQFEKLWGDMTSLPEASTEFFLIPRQRGQQLKEVAHLDGWDRDGSRSFIESLCEFV